MLFRSESFIADLDQKYRHVVEHIMIQFKLLGDLTTAAFDFELNVSLLSRSVELAQAYGVAEDKILKSVAEVDDDFLS